jgi:DHA1 family multidrug resistance protein-like MFS transporter
MFGRRAPTPTSGPSTAEPISWKRNLYALWIAQTLVLVAFTFRDAFLPFYMKELGDLSNNQAALWSGASMALGSLIMVPAAPVWGRMAARLGRTPLVLRAIWASVITAGLMAFATAPWQLVVLRMTEGALAGTVAASAALVSSTAPREHMGYALGLIQTAVFAGASIGPFLGGVLANLIGYRATLLSSAGLLAIGGIIVLVFVRENFVPAERGPERGLAAIKASRAWLLTPALLTMTAIPVLMRFVQMGGRPILPLFIESLGDYTEAQAASLAGISFGLMGLTSAISSMVLGRQGDRVGHRKILVACLIASVICYFPMAAVLTPWQVILLQGLFGFALGGLLPSSNAIIAANTPVERRGAVFGFTSSAGSMGAFVGPLVGSGLAATMGFRFAFAFLAVVLLVAAVAILWSQLGGRQASVPSDDSLPSIDRAAPTA